MSIYNKIKTKRTTSENGIELLKSFEGFRHRAYVDSAGVWTIGYGSTYIYSRRVREDDHISMREAEAQLYLDLLKFEATVNELVTVYITQNQFDALVSFVYNVGENAFKNSTLLAKLNDERYAESGAEFSRWVHAGGRKIDGLVARRAKEKELFFRDVSLAT